jgi:hypothetical protein
LEFGELGGIIWVRKPWNFGMITNKKNIGRALGILLATIYAGLITAAVHTWTGLHTAPTLLVFAGLWIGFYFAGIWAATDRPAELDKRFPISSKELRRRKKTFYDWLNSQGRR